MELRLYVAGNAPNSVRAVANLRAICRAYLQDGYHLEIIDVLTEPARALQDGILVTPTLIKRAPPPTVRMIGDLSRTTDVLHILGLESRT